MENNCMNCKWYVKGECINKDNNRNLSVNASMNDGVSYVEEGHFSESMRENISMKELSMIIIRQLREQDFLKKTKKVENFDYEAIEDEVVELLDESLSRSIMNYFDEEKEVTFSINEPRDFCCNNWE